MGSACGRQKDKTYMEISGKYGLTLVDWAQFKSKLSLQKEYESTHSHHNLDVHLVWESSLSSHDITKIYVFETEQIGEGHFGIVRRARLISDPNKVYAIKTINKKKLKGDIVLLKNELELLRTMDHPNIAQFYEIYQDETFYHFVMEYCSGGDITNVLEKEGEFSEERAKFIIHEALLAVNYIHSIGVAHRDLKPDNFLFKDPSEGSSVKLIDFGLSVEVGENAKLSQCVGTPFYMAPEVIKGDGYNQRADMWSLGVTLFMLFTAEFPFYGQSTKQVFSAVTAGKYPQNKLSRLSAEALNVLSGLLSVDPQTRMSAAEALRHPWFRHLDCHLMKMGKEQITGKLLTNLIDFKSDCRFGQEVIRLLVTIQEDAPEIKKLRYAFYYLDMMNHGVIQEEDLRKVYQEHGLHLNSSEVEDIIDHVELRTHGHGVITYSQFLAAAVDEGFYHKDSYLREAFARFDVDADGVITVPDLRDAFNRFGLSVSLKEIISYITLFDLDHDHQIGLSDFMRMMGKEFHTHLHHIN